MFKVSVVIPVYNAEKFLAKAIDSALLQPETAEVILVEDASPDNCLNICKEYQKKDPRVKLFQHTDKKNHGAAASFNLGIQKATHEFIAILGADDYFLPNRFKKDKAIFEHDNSTDGVYSAIEAYAADEAGKIRKLETGLNLTTVTKTIEPENLFYEMAPVGTSGYFSLNGLTIKKQALIDVGLFDPKLRLSQDTHISIKLAAKYKLVAGSINKPVAMFAMHQNNRSHYPEKLRANRPYLFYDLYQWARTEKLDMDKVFILWQRFYEYNLLVNKLNRPAQRKLLLTEFLKNPLLFRFHFFKKQLPVLSRLMP